MMNPVGGSTLAIDTSSATASVAVYDGQILAETTWRGGRNHSRALVRVIDVCLDLAGRDRAALGAIALASGPGSYSGLRVGASTAIGLALSLGIEVVHVPTLDVIAYSVGGRGLSIRAAVEMGRGRYATALYGWTDAGLEQQTEIESMDLAQLADRARMEGALLAGDLPPVNPSPTAEGEGRVSANLRRAGFLAELAVQRMRAGTAEAPGQLIYLRN